MAAKAASASIFAALGDHTRLRLLARLCAGGPQNVTRLTAGSAVSRQAVAKHLRVLAEAGLVRGLRHGRESRWEVAPEQIELARRYLDRISEQWTRRLKALERHLDGMLDAETSLAAPATRGTPAARTRAGPRRRGSR
ncbi:MAG TPA: metalloregulator ArsR/SmtB family transcription factor [Vicinamibacteria bacterium]|nr:metalloregulator ArsR/SmtB family transcription factor [Vicinamibacteria bacterium]